MMHHVTRRSGFSRAWLALAAVLLLGGMAPPEAPVAESDEIEKPATKKKTARKKTAKKAARKKTAKS